MNLLQYARDHGFTIYSSDQYPMEDTKAIYINTNQSIEEQKRDIVFSILTKQGVDQKDIYNEASKLLIPLDRIITIESSFEGLNYPTYIIDQHIASILRVYIGFIKIRRRQIDYMEVMC